MLEHTTPRVTADTDGATDSSGTTRPAKGTKSHA